MVFKLFLIFLFMVLPFSAWADIHTVCPSGCTNTTLASAYAAASCGDTVELHFDDSIDEKEISMSKNCSSGPNPITVINGTGHTPSISATSCASGCGSVITLSGQYNTLDGFTIKDNGNGAAVWVTGSNNTVQNMTFSNNCTGAYPGAQGYGTVEILGSSNIIQNSTFGDSGHGAIQLHYMTGAVQYNQVLNNTIHDHYGHGIWVGLSNVSYNLIDGNYISDSGSLCVGSGCGSKNCIEVSGGSNNSFRRNVCFDAYNRGVEASSLSSGMTTADNWFYNNTFYNIGISTSTSGVNSWVTLSTAGGSTNYVTGNHFYNNIADKVGQRTFGDFGYRLAFTYYCANEQDLGDNLTELGTTNDWRENWLKNNDIRPYNASTSLYDDLATAIDYHNAGGSYHPEWTVTGVNGVGSQSGNIRSDPLFTSTDTSTTHWWYLLAGSPCIDTGIVVTDPNATTGGWSQLTYNGTAPDMGAYETDLAPAKVEGLTIKGGTLK